MTNNCRACGAEIEWGHVKGKDGYDRPHPFDAGTNMKVSHFSTCRYASVFRKGLDASQVEAEVARIKKREKEKEKEDVITQTGNGNWTLEAFKGGDEVWLAL